MKTKRITVALLALCIASAGPALAQECEKEAARPHIMIPESGPPGMAQRAADVETVSERFQLLNNLQTRNVKGTIDIAADSPRIDMEYTVANLRDKPLRTQTGPMGFESKELVLQPGASSTLRFAAPLEVTKTGRAIRAVRVSPQLHFQEGLSLRPVESYAIDILLPSDAKKLIKANKTLLPQGTKDGRLAYRWEGSYDHLTTLALWWTTSDTDLSLTKDLRPDWKNRTADVTLRVKNDGKKTARGIVLAEDFPSQSFEGIAGESDGTFTIYRGDENDERLIWQHELIPMAPGQEMEVKYRLRMKHDVPVVRLYETSALEGGEAVVVTKPVAASRK